MKLFWNIIYKDIQSQKLGKAHDENVLMNTKTKKNKQGNRDQLKLPMSEGDEPSS